MLPLRLFYLLKPLIPRKLQILLRRLRARRIWARLGRSCLPAAGTYSASFTWPAPYRAAALVTHDVETAVGQANIPALRRIEDELGVKSCWNFVVERYAVDEALIHELAADGHEIGVHGTRHDGKLFSSPETFRRRWRKIEEAARRWGSCGFRSPAMLYDEALLATVNLSWDSTLPAWDPFQPIPGGCGKFHPYLLNESCVELPLTLWQDFTLFEELGFDSIEVWRRQIDFLHEQGGLINLVFHPDYTLSEKRREYYRQLLQYLLAKPDLWVATPSQIAAWVRRIPQPTV